MRIISLIIVIAVLLTVGASNAQVMYRCGNTFSQQPCGPDAKELATPGVRQPRIKTPPPPDLPAPAGVEDNAKGLCKAAMVARLKDPESAKISEIHRSRTATWPLDNGVRRPVRYYWMTVNAKNSYGGYVGDKQYRCALTIDETLVLDISNISESTVIVE